MLCHRVQMTTAAVAAHEENVAQCHPQLFLAAVVAPAADGPLASLPGSVLAGRAAAAVMQERAKLQPCLLVVGPPAAVGGVMAASAVAVVQEPA